MKSIISLLITLLAFATAGAALQSADPTFSFKDALAIPSKFWPTLVNTVKEIDLEVKSGRAATISEGTRAVVIRLEPSGQLLVDFGREGIHLVDPSATNFVELSHAVANGKIDKLYGIMAGMIAQRLTIPTESGELLPYSFKTVNESDYFMLAYIEDDAGQFRVLSDFQKTSSELLKSTATTFLLMPTFDYRNKELSARLHAAGVRVPFMYDYLVKPYTKTMSHKPQPPALIVTDANGRILERYEGSLEAFEMGLKLCLDLFEVTDSKE